MQVVKRQEIHNINNNMLSFLVAMLWLCSVGLASLERGS